MKDIAFAFLARIAELTLDGQLVIIGPDIDGFMCPQFPTCFQFSFVAKLIFAADEVSQPHTISIDYAKLDGSRVSICPEVPISLKTNPQDPSGDVKSVIVLGTGASIDSPGTYTIYATIDQKEVIEKSLNIQKIPPGIGPLIMKGL